MAEQGNTAAWSAPQVRDNGAVTSEGELQRRLLWLAAFRIAAITVLLGTTAVLSFKGDQALGGRTSMALSSLAVGTNLLQIGVILLARLRRYLRALAYAQIAGDVVFAGALVYLTGGADSLFTFMYLLAIVNGGILLNRQGAWAAAGGAFAAHSALVLGIQFRVLAPAEGTAAGAMSWAALYQALFAHGAAFGLTAVVASYAAMQLEKAGARADEAESSLNKLGVLHDAIVRSIGSGIVTADEHDLINFLNRAGEEILGIRGGTLQGQPLDLIFPHLGEALDQRGRGLQRLECGWRHPDGSQRILGFAIHPLTDEAGRRLGIAAVFQDLTGVRELELRAARSERLASVGEVSAGLAHELRNPLASMAGSIRLLGAGRQLTDDERELIDIVQRESSRLNVLVTDFLGFARPSPPRPSAVDLPARVGETISIFRGSPDGARVEFELSLAPALARVDGDQLAQLLWNLLVNAAQASSDGGRIRVTTGRGTQSGTVCLRVEDEGCGIPAEVVGRIFDPFFSTKERGTGLGLALVHRIVDANGGQIGVQSEPGRGTSFTVVLPAAAEA